MWYLLAVTIGTIIGWSICSCCVIAKKVDAQDAPHEEGPVVYDFERYLDEQQLTNLIIKINTYGYRLISVSQDGDLYSVFFARSCNG